MFFRVGWENTFAWVKTLLGMEWQKFGEVVKMFWVGLEIDLGSGMAKILEGIVGGVEKILLRWHDFLGVP